MSELPFEPKDKPPVSRPVRPPAPRRPIVVPESSKRDTFIALACGAGVLLLVLFGILALHGEQGKPSANQLTGTITAKHDSEQTEKEITIGKKGLKSKETDSGYSFTVHVDELNRDFEVPALNEAHYRSKKVGDKQKFIRPPSEQK